MALARGRAVHDGGSTYVECDEFDTLIGFGSGDLVIVSQYQHGVLKDRWLAHKDEPLELRYIEAGEELRVVRLGIDQTSRERAT